MPIDFLQFIYYNIIRGINQPDTLKIFLFDFLKETRHGRKEKRRKEDRSTHIKLREL